MTTEEAKQAKREKQKFQGTVILAALGAVTAVGNGARSYFERQADVERAAAAEANRVEVDTSIQVNIQQAVDDLHQQHDDDFDALMDRIEDMDREIFELGVELEAQNRFDEVRGDVDAKIRAELLQEALKIKAKQRRHTVRRVSDDTPLEPEETQDVIQEVAKEIVEKKTSSKKRKERPRPKLDFVTPKPVYQLQQQMQQALPPRPPGIKK